MSEYSGMSKDDFKPLMESWRKGKNAANTLPEAKSRRDVKRLKLRLRIKLLRIKYRGV